MIHVVLDTNILHEEGLFSRNMQLLGRLAIAGAVVIYVPDLVKREYLTRRVGDASSKLQSIHAGLTAILKKTDRSNQIYAELTSSQTTLSNIAKTIHEAVDKDFDRWMTANNVELLHFEPLQVSAIFDDYFSGRGVFRQAKSREDLPDAFINACVQTLLGKTKNLDVIVKDGAFRQHLQKVEGITVFDDLETYMQSEKIVECISVLDAKSDRTDRLKQFFASEAFTSHLTAYLRTATDQMSDIYIEEEDIYGQENLEMESAFAARVSSPKADTIEQVEVSAINQIDEGHFSLEISFIAATPLSFCGDYRELTALPQDRQNRINMDSMGGDGVCDLGEERKVAFSGHAELRFDSQYSAETLASHTEYLDSHNSKIKVEIEIDTAAIL